MQRLFMRGVGLQQKDGRPSVTTGNADVFGQARSHDYTNQQFCVTPSLGL